MGPGVGLGTSSRMALFVWQCTDSEAAAGHGGRQDGGQEGRQEEWGQEERAPQDWPQIVWLASGVRSCARSLSETARTYPGVRRTVLTSSARC